MGYFDNQRNAYHAAGYRTGLTMQALPYDWRKGYRENKLDWKFERTIDSLFDITGKRVVIIAHSMGNFQTVHNLWKMDQKKKDERVARFMSLAGPFLGSAEASIVPYAMDKQFGVNLINLVQAGIVPYTFKNCLASWPTLFQL